MSQSKVFCRGITESQSYLSLISAVERRDAEGITTHYRAISQQVKEFSQEVWKRIENATQVRGRPDYLYIHAERDYQQFRNSFDREAEKYIPLWHLNFLHAENEVLKEKTREILKGGEGSTEAKSS